MLEKLKKPLLAALVILITFSAIAAPVAHAQEDSGPERQLEGQGQWWYPRYSDFLDKVNQAPPNEIFGERYTHAQVSWIINSILNIIVGPVAACADDPDFGGCMENALNGNTGDAGAIIPLAMLTDTMLETRPASSIDYVAQKLQRIGIVDEAYAQTTTQAGFGFTNSLAIIQALWTIARDAAYSLVILMILLLGFMVMFRAQLSPRTVITIQSALPRIVIGLLLITFSYAIAGLLVDLTFVLQGVVAGVFSSSNLLNISALTTFQQMNDVIGSVGFLTIALILSFFAVVLGSGAVASTGLALLSPLGPFAAILAGFGIILVLLVVILMFISLARVWWVMMKTYVVIILLVFVSPFIFLIGIVRDGMNGMWFKQMIANLSVFFTVSMLIIVANVLLFSTARVGVLGNAFQFFETINLNVNPFDIPYETVPSDIGVMPGFTSLGSTDIIGAIIALGVFISIPKLAGAVRDQIATGRGGFGMSSFSEAGGGVASSAGKYGVSRATRGNAEEINRIETEARRLSQTPEDYARAGGRIGEFRRRKAVSSLAETVKKRL